jgi:hypothetical protein
MGKIFPLLAQDHPGGHHADRLRRLRVLLLERVVALEPRDVILGRRAHIRVPGLAVARLVSLHIPRDDRAVSQSFGISR